MKRIVLLLGLTAAAGCGGGGSSSSIPPSSMAAVPTTAPGSGNGTTAQTRVNITIPAPSTLSSVRRIRYVSSSTNSLTLTTSAGVTVINLGASSPNCSTTAGVRNCVISVQLPEGTNVPFTARTYASTDGSGSTLSIATGTTTVVANQTNTLNLTLNAVVAGLRVALAPMPFTSGTAGTATVTTTVLDAAGQVIVVGPNNLVDQNDNPVAVTLATSDTSGATHVSPTTLSAAAVTLSYNGGTASTGAAVAATASNGSTASAAIQFSALPTPAPIGAVQNGAEWPTSFRPYGPTSPWNRPLSNTTNPTLVPNSDSIVQVAESANTGANVRTQEYGAGYDVSHPVVVASSTDPLVTPHCTTYCSPLYLTQPFHIPAKARPASGSDHHLGVIQPDGTEIDMWYVNQPSGDWTNGATINYGSGNSCGNFYTGVGFVAGGATVSGACLAGGLVRASEISSGTIPHAIFLTTGCLDRTYVYPASQPGDNVCTGSGPNVPNGSHVWLDLSDSAIDALSLQPWEKTVLHALHQYGGYVGDSGGSSLSHTNTVVQFLFEDDAQFQPFGVTSPMVTLAQSLGWTPASIAPASSAYSTATRYVASDNWQPVNWASHLHIVDPCYAQGSC